MRPVEDFKTLIVDKPFLFFIRDNLTNVVLFAGRVSNPEIAPPESSEEEEEESETPLPVEDSNLVAPTKKNTEKPAEPAPLSVRKPGRPPPVPSFVGRPSGFLSEKNFPEHVPSSINFEDFQNNPKKGLKKPSVVPNEPHYSAPSSAEQPSTPEKVSDSLNKHFANSNDLGAAPSSLTTTPPPLIRKPDKASASGHTFVTTTPPPLIRKPSKGETSPSPATSRTSLNELPSKSSTPNTPLFSFESPSQKKSVLRTLYVEHLMIRDDLPWALYKHNLFINFSDRSKRRRSPVDEKITFQP